MAIKYVCKYINKGTDQATCEIKNKDEISCYQSGRYLSSAEAVYRILEFDIHRHYPPVQALDVHLENGQRIFFNPDDLLERLENPSNTTLLAFFKLCREDNFARTLLYSEVPSYFTLKSGKVFQKRVAHGGGVPVSGHPSYYKHNVIGRLHSVSPRMNDCFHLRMLLNHVVGPTSFEFLRTVNGVVYSTYQEACGALNLLDDDTHWEATLSEAKHYRSANKIRETFVITTVFGQPSSSINLWDKFKIDMYEDFLFKYQTKYPNARGEHCHEYASNQGLSDLQIKITAIGGHNLSEYGLPVPHIVSEIEEPVLNVAELDLYINQNEPLLNAEQRRIYNMVISGIENNRGETIFLDAPGGTGKTFLL